MNETFRREQAILTLDAIVSALEGEMKLGHHGYIRAYSNEFYDLFLECEDGNVISPQQAPLDMLEGAIDQWRDENMQFFQKVLGAMM